MSVEQPQAWHSIYLRESEEVSQHYGRYNVNLNILLTSVFTSEFVREVIWNSVTSISM